MGLYAGLHSNNHYFFLLFVTPCVNCAVMFHHVRPPAFWYFLVVGLSGLSWTALSNAANLVVNGEFTAGTTGWNTLGTVFTTGQSAVLSDQGGSRVLLFQTMAVPLESTAALTLRYDLFTALSPSAGLGQTPDTVFLSAFLGSTSFGNDFAAGLFDTAVSLQDVDFRGVANLAPGLNSSPSPKGAGWTRYQLALPLSGFVTVSFEFLDGNGVLGDSTAAVDNVVLETVPIPEPGVSLLLAGAGLALHRSRRMAS